MISATLSAVSERNGTASEDGCLPQPETTQEVIDGASGLTAAEIQELVERIQMGDSAAMEDLYRLFSRGVRFYMCRHLGHQELEDKVHDTFVIVVQAIRKGELRDPGRLMGFVRTIVRRQVAACIDEAVSDRKDRMDLEAGAHLAGDGDPEESVIGQENADLIERVLLKLSERDREILKRFYLDDQSQEQICSEMGLSETQFRLLKSRAKTRFAEIGKKKVSKRPVRSFWVRNSLTA